MRIQQQTQEVMSASTSKEGQTLMNLNLKLQSSAARMQSKTVELELKKIEAAQLAEHMRIITVSLFTFPRYDPNLRRRTCPSRTMRPRQTQPQSCSSFTASPRKSICSSISSPRSMDFLPLCIPLRQSFLSGCASFAASSDTFRHSTSDSGRSYLAQLRKTG